MLSVIPGYNSQNFSQPTTFSIGSTANVQISGLTLSNGSDAESGIPTIGNAGTLTLSACTIENTLHGLIENDGAMILSGCTISGNFNTGPLILNSDAALTVSNCTLTGNSGSSLVYNDGEAATLTVSSSTFSGNLGVCIVNSSGSATVTYSTFSENRDTNLFNDYMFNGYPGGAIIRSAGMTIDNSIISDNLAIGDRAYSSASGGPAYPARSASGGGIYVSGGTLSISSSTITGNEAIGGSTGSLGDAEGPAGNGQGGGLYIAGGSVSINNSTLDDNEAVGGAATLPGIGGAGYGGGIDNAAGPGALQLYDTILADNSTSTEDPDLDGFVDSLGYNLFGNSSGGSGFAANDLVNVNPQLGPLQNNGGPTQTMALLPGSPAIDAGDNANAPAYDQRGPGFSRIINGTIDIGAFEVQSSSNQADSLTVTGFPSVITAGAAGTFTVTALNADGSIDTAYNGTVQFTSSDIQAGLPADYTFTAADGGVHTFTATLKTAGNQSLTITDTTYGTQGTESGIDVRPTAASHFTVSTPNSGMAGSPFSVTLIAFDPYNNIVTGYTGTVHFSSTDGQASLPSNYTFTSADAGVHTFSNGVTLKTAGSQSIAVADISNTAITGNATVAVSPAAASTLIVSGFPSTTTAGVAHSVTVTAKDAYGNIASGYIGAVHFTSSDAKAILPANYTFTAADGGVHSFTVTLKTAGTQSITATDAKNANLTGADGGITVNAAAASKFVITAPTCLQPGIAFSLTMTVEDAFSNIVTGYTGMVHFSSSDNTATLPANYKFTAADKGIHTFTGVVLRKKGNQRITITDTQNGSLTGSVTVDVL
jgi:hypothetical protein